MNRSSTVDSGSQISCIITSAFQMNPLTPEFIPRAKRYNETFLKIFNDSLKQFLTAAASPSNVRRTQEITLHRFECRKEHYIRI